MKQDSFVARTVFKNAIPPSAQLYILSVIGIALPIFCYCLWRTFRLEDPGWMGLVVLTIVSSMFPVKMPLIGGKAQSLSITMGDIFVFLALFLYGTPAAVTMAVAEGLTINARATIHQIYKRVFNLAQLTLVSFAVGQVFYLLEGKPGPLDPTSAVHVGAGQYRLLLQAGFCGLLYFVLNSGLLGVVMSLVTKKRLLDLWKENFVWASITHFAGALLSAVVFLHYQDYQLYLIGVALPIAILIYYTYKINLGRTQQAQKHLDEVNALLTKIQRVNDELELRVRERTAELTSANEQLRVEIGDREQAEEALASEKERLAVTLGSIGDGVIATDMLGRVVLINKIAQDITGFSEAEAVARPLVEIFHIIDRKTGQRREDPFIKVLETRARAGLEAKDVVLVSQDGTQRSVSHSASPIREKDGDVAGVVLVFRDITQQQKMEEELMEAQKLESLGVFAGGIAHDFNNVLSGILFKTQLAQRSWARGKDPSRFLTSIEEATEMATGLTQQLLTFAKGGQPIKEVASVKELVQDSATFALRGSKTRSNFEICDDLWAVEVDKGQISQVINNLVINSSQAMPSGGTITIRAENIEVSAENPVAELPAGPFIKISVEDQGEGISPENLPRIFDPYFTTKPKGHGLGLATTHSIIESHGGYVSVESVVKKGSTFTIYLPASRQVVETKVVESVKREHSGGRVLVMDDDQIIRDSLGELLEELGCEVDFAKDGAEAIFSYKKALQGGNPFDVIIMDLTIPGGMGGKEAIQELLAIDPRVTAVVSSGYSKDPVMSDFKSHGFSAVLAKPFTADKLNRVMAEVFESKSITVQNSQPR